MVRRKNANPPAERARPGQLVLSFPLAIVTQIGAGPEKRTFLFPLGAQKMRSAVRKMAQRLHDYYMEYGEITSTVEDAHLWLSTPSLAVKERSVLLTYHDSTVDLTGEHMDGVRWERNGLPVSHVVVLVWDDAVKEKRE